MIKTVRRPLGAAVGFLALVDVAASATHYLQEPYNPADTGQRIMPTAKEWR